MRNAVIALGLILISMISFAKEAPTRKPNQVSVDGGRGGFNTDPSIRDISCFKKDYSVSYTLTIFSQFAPGSRVATNISAIKFVAQPNGGGRIEKEIQYTRAEEIFDSEASAKDYFLNNEVLLVLSARENPLLFNLGQKTLKVLDLKQKQIVVLNCNIGNSK